MHELSLSYATVETVLESIAELRVNRVKSISMIAGELSGVALDAFRFSFPIAAEGTQLEGCELQIKTEPVTVFCPACNSIGALCSIYSFRCPKCGEPTGDIRSGQQFAIQSIEIEPAEELQHEHAHC